MFCSKERQICCKLNENQLNWEANHDFTHCNLTLCCPKKSSVLLLLLLATDYSVDFSEGFFCHLWSVRWWAGQGNNLWNYIYSCLLLYTFMGWGCNRIWMYISNHAEMWENRMHSLTPLSVQNNRHIMLSCAFWGKLPNLRTSVELDCWYLANLWTFYLLSYLL